MAGWSRQWRKHFLYDESATEHPHDALKHWGVNAGYQVVAFSVMGTILGAWH